MSDYSLIDGIDRVHLNEFSRVISTSFRGPEPWPLMYWTKTTTCRCVGRMRRSTMSGRTQVGQRLYYIQNFINGKGILIIYFSLCWLVCLFVYIHTQNSINGKGIFIICFFYYARTCFGYLCYKKTLPYLRVLWNILKELYS